MRSLAHLGLAGLLLATPAAAQALHGVEQFLVDGSAPRRVSDPDSPCGDSLFAALRARPLDSLSTREYAYFMMKSRECAEYRRAAGIDRHPPRTGISEWSGGDPDDGDSSGVAGLALFVAVISLAVAASAIYGLSHLFAWRG